VDENDVGAAIGALFARYPVQRAMPETPAPRAYISVRIPAMDRHTPR